MAQLQHAASDRRGPTVTVGQVERHVAPAVDVDRTGPADVAAGQAAQGVTDRVVIERDRLRRDDRAQHHRLVGAGRVVEGHRRGLDVGHGRSRIPVRIAAGKTPDTAPGVIGPQQVREPRREDGHRQLVSVGQALRRVITRGRDGQVPRRRTGNVPPAKSVVRTAVIGGPALRRRWWRTDSCDNSDSQDRCSGRCGSNNRRPRRSPRKARTYRTRSRSWSSRRCLRRCRR